MCVVSMLTEHYRDRWIERLPDYVRPWPLLPHPYTPQPQQPIDVEALQQFLAPKEPAITQEEIAEFRALLVRAREYDKRYNEPACEMREKQDALIAVAKALGVTITIEELNA